MRKKGKREETMWKLRKNLGEKKSVVIDTDRVVGEGGILALFWSFSAVIFDLRCVTNRNKGLTEGVSVETNTRERKKTLLSIRLIPKQQRYLIGSGEKIKSEVGVGKSGQKEKKIQMYQIQISRENEKTKYIYGSSSVVLIVEPRQLLGIERQAI